MSSSGTLSNTRVACEVHVENRVHRAFKEIPFQQGINETDDTCSTTTSNIYEITPVYTLNQLRDLSITLHATHASEKGNDHWTKNIFSLSEIWKLVLLMVGVVVVILTVATCMRYFCQILRFTISSKSSTATKKTCCNCQESLTKDTEHKQKKTEEYEEMRDNEFHTGSLPVPRFPPSDHDYASCNGSSEGRESQIYSVGIPDNCTWIRDSQDSGSFSSSIRETKQFCVSSSVMNQRQDSTQIRSEVSSHTYYSVIDEYQEGSRTTSHDIELVHSYSLRIDDHVQESGGKTTGTETTNGNYHNRGKQSQNVAPEKATGTQIQHKQGYPAKPKPSSGNVPPRVPSKPPCVKTGRTALHPVSDRKTASTPKMIAGTPGNCGPVYQNKMVVTMHKAMMTEKR